MRKNNILYRIIIFAIITLGIFIWNFKARIDSSSKSIGINITKWDNFYSGR